MKKLVSLLLVVLFAVSAVGCAKFRADEKTRVKCPACGYEFEMPAGG